MSEAEKRGPIETITLRGYKSIREVVDLQLRAGLNVLIGANGSGKTNFIRFFEMLGHMMDSSKGLQNYVAQRGGADAFLFRGMKVTPELSARLMTQLNIQSITNIMERLQAPDTEMIFTATNKLKNPFDVDQQNAPRPK